MDILLKMITEDFFDVFFADYLFELSMNSNPKILNMINTNVYKLYLNIYAHSTIGIDKQNFTFELIHYLSKYNTNPEIHNIIINILEQEHNEQSNNIDFSNNFWVQLGINYYNIFKNSIMLNIVLNNLEELFKSNNNTLLYKICSYSSDSVVDCILKYVDKFNIYCWRGLCSNTNDKIIDTLFNYINKHNYMNKIDDFCFNKLLNNENEKITNLLNKNNINNVSVFKIIYQRMKLNNTNIKIIIDNIKLFSCYYLNLLSFKCDEQINPELLDELFEKILIDKTNPLKSKLWSNPNIYTYDYDMMKNNRNKLINKHEINNIIIS